MAQRVDGRIVDRDDGNVAVTAQADWIAHGRCPWGFLYL
jgi:hypothetical protein